MVDVVGPSWSVRSYTRLHLQLLGNASTGNQIALINHERPSDAVENHERNMLKQPTIAQARAFPLAWQLSTLGWPLAEPYFWPRSASIMLIAAGKVKLTVCLGDDVDGTIMSLIL